MSTFGQTMTTGRIVGVFERSIPQLRLTGSATQARVAEIRCGFEGHLANRDQLAAWLGRGAAEPPATVVAAGFRAQGDRFMSMIRGDFTIVGWNSRARAGVLARDALGGGSLYFHISGDTLRFASELRDLLELLPTRPAVNHEALLHWLSLQAPRGSQTLYAGIRALEPGQLLRFGSDDRFRVERWFTPRYQEPLALERHDLVAQMRAKLELSVSRSAGPGETTGILLNGGLDSTAVAALAQNAPDVARRPMASYSLVNSSSPSADESHYIDAVSDELGLPNARLAVEGGSMVGGALDFIREWELPPRAGTLSFLLPLLQRASQDGVTTMLDGEGGDLLFDAPRELIADRLRAGRIISALELARRVTGTPAWRPVLQLLREHGVMAALPGRVHRLLWEHGDKARHAPPWIRAHDVPWIVDSDRSMRCKRYDGPRWWARRAEALFSGQHALGRRDEARRRGQMAGLASRSPLLDLDLVNFVLQMPPDLGFDPLMGRRIVHEAMSGVLPRAERLRPGNSYVSELTRRCLTGEDLRLIRGLLGGR